MTYVGFSGADGQQPYAPRSGGMRPNHSPGFHPRYQTPVPSLPSSRLVTPVTGSSSLSHTTVCAPIGGSSRRQFPCFPTSPTHRLRGSSPPYCPGGACVISSGIPSLPSSSLVTPVIVRHPSFLPPSAPHSGGAEFTSLTLYIFM